MLALVKKKLKKLKKQTGLKKKGGFFVNKCFKQARMCLKNKETRIMNLEILSKKEYSSKVIFMAIFVLTIR